MQQNPGFRPGFRPQFRGPAPPRQRGPRPQGRLVINFNSHAGGWSLRGR